MRLSGILGAWCLFAAWIYAASANAADLEPYEMVRTLQELQGQMAHGNSQAVAAQRALLLKMDTQFTRAPGETWQDPRNARAAVVHVLSGGHPTVLRRLMAFDPPPAVEPGLMQAALAYVEGREADVVRHLEAIDIRALPPALGGQIALIKSAAVLRTDPQQALDLLTLARLLMPGSLVEEAALRREIFVAGKIGDIERFQSLTIGYLRRYRESYYAGDFRRRFALAIDALGFGSNGEKFALLEGLLSEFDDDTQRALYLRLARTGLLSGQAGIVRKASSEGLKHAMRGSDEELLFHLYQAGVQFDVDHITEARDLLWSIDRSRLGVEDQGLLEGIYAVINSVRHYPDPPPGVIGEMDVYERLPQPQAGDWVMPSMVRLQKLINETDVLLDKVGG